MDGWPAPVRAPRAADRTWSAHSLGGLVALESPEPLPGSCRRAALVCLGSPLAGSAARARAQGARRSAVVAGRSGALLRGGLLPVPGQREVGVIAGTRPGAWAAASAALRRPERRHRAPSGKPGSRACRRTSSLPASHTGLIVLAAWSPTWRASFLRPGVSSLKRRAKARLAAIILPPCSTSRAGCMGRLMAIEGRKNAQDAKRGKIFTKLIRETRASRARAGGGDPEDQSAPAHGDGQARSASTWPRTSSSARSRRRPANSRASTTRKSATRATRPGGVAVIVDCMTDNKVRTVGRRPPRLQQVRRQPRHRWLGRLHVQEAAACSVSPPAPTKTRVTEAAIEAGADDVVVYPEDGAIDVLTSPEAFEAVKAAMVAAGLAADEAEVTLRADNDVAVDGDTAAAGGQAARHARRPRRRAERLLQRRARRRRLQRDAASSASTQVRSAPASASSTVDAAGTRDACVPCAAGCCWAPTISRCA